MKKIMIIAGEPSGDAHAAKLVDSLQEKHYKFYGIGGSQMQASGVELIETIDNMSIMGIAEVVAHLPFLYKTLLKLKHSLKQSPPDLLILVDFQSFNFKLAKMAKRLGIKSLFYIGPQIWAWRSYRVKKFKKIVDHVAVIFPFEVDFYKRHGMQVAYVGHPLLEKIDSNYSRADFLNAHKISLNKRIISFLPGSRSSEITKHMPIILNAIQQLANNTQYEFLVSRYQTNNVRANKHFTNLPSQVKVIDKDFYAMLNASDFAVVASGTATLEAALLKTPMLVIAKVSRLSYLIYKRMIKIPFISIVNIIANKKVVTELIQHNVTPENIVLEVNNFFQATDQPNKMKRDFKMVKDCLNIKPKQNLKNLVLALLND